MDCYIYKQVKFWMGGRGEGLMPVSGVPAHDRLMGFLYLYPAEHRGSSIRRHPLKPEEKKWSIFDVRITTRAQFWDNRGVGK